MLYEFNGRNFRVSIFVVRNCSCHRPTSKKVAVPGPNSERVGDLQRGALLLVDCEGHQIVSGCQIHRMPVAII